MGIVNVKNDEIQIRHWVPCSLDEGERRRILVQENAAALRDGGYFWNTSHPAIRYLILEVHGKTEERAQ